MAYPQIADTNKGFTTANATSTTINPPGGTTAGDLIILLIAKDGTGTFTQPANWNTLANTAGAAQTVGIFYRILTGPLSSFTISHASEMTAWIICRIPNSAVPQISSRANDSTNTPNPPSLTHSFGAGVETYWFAVAGWDYNRTCSGYPSNFGMNRDSSVSTSTGGAGIAMAALQSTTNPQNPNSFTISSADTWDAYTIAIKSNSIDATITQESSALCPVTTNSNSIYLITNVSIAHNFTTTSASTIIPEVNVLHVSITQTMGNTGATFVIPRILPRIGYNLYRAVDAGSFELYQVFENTESSFDDYNVTLGDHTYHYKLTRYADGLESDYSSTYTSETSGSPRINATMASASASTLTHAVSAIKNATITHEFATTNAQASPHSVSTISNVSITDITKSSMSTGVEPAIYTTWNVLIVQLIINSVAAGTPPSAFAIQNISVLSGTADSGASGIIPTVSATINVDITQVMGSAAALGIEPVITSELNAQVEQTTGLGDAQAFVNSIFTTSNSVVAQTTGNSTTNIILPAISSGSNIYQLIGILVAETLSPLIDISSTIHQISSNANTSINIPNIIIDSFIIQTTSNSQATFNIAGISTDSNSEIIQTSSQAAASLIFPEIFAIRNVNILDTSKLISANALEPNVVAVRNILISQEEAGYSLVSSLPPAYSSSVNAEISTLTAELNVQAISPTLNISCTILTSTGQTLANGIEPSIIVSATIAQVLAITSSTTIVPTISVDDLVSTNSGITTAEMFNPTINILAEIIQITGQLSSEMLPPSLSISEVIITEQGNSNAIAIAPEVLATKTSAIAQETGTSLVSALAPIIIVDVIVITSIGTTSVSANASAIYFDCTIVQTTGFAAATMNDAYGTTEGNTIIPGPTLLSSGIMISPEVSSELHISLTQTTGIVNSLMNYPLIDISTVVIQPSTLLQSSSIVPLIIVDDLVPTITGTSISEVLPPTLHASTSILQNTGNLSASAQSPNLNISDIILIEQANTTTVGIEPEIFTTKSTTIVQNSGLSISTSLAPSTILDVVISITDNCISSTNSTSPSIYFDYTISQNTATAIAIMNPAYGNSEGNVTVPGPTIITFAVGISPIVESERYVTIAQLYNTASASAVAPLIVIDGLVNQITNIANADLNSPIIVAEIHSAIHQTPGTGTIQSIAPQIYFDYSIFTNQAQIEAIGTSPTITTTSNVSILTSQSLSTTLMVTPIVESTSNTNVEQTLSIATSTMIAPTINISDIIVTTTIVGTSTLNNPTITAIRSVNIAQTTMESSIVSIVPNVSSATNKTITTGQISTITISIPPEIKISCAISAQISTTSAQIDSPNINTTWNAKIDATINLMIASIINPLIIVSQEINGSVAESTAEMYSIEVIPETAILTIPALSSASMISVFVEAIFANSILVPSMIIEPIMIVPVRRIVNYNSPFGSSVSKQIINKEKSITFYSPTKQRRLLDKQSEQTLIAKQKSSIFNEITKTF